KIRSQVVELSRRVLGPEHSKTLVWTSELAEVESTLGKHAEAEKLCRQVLEIQRRTLAAENPELLMTMMTLANVLGRERRYDEAERLHLETLAIRQRVLGPNHPDIGLSLYGFGTLALRPGQRRKALDLLSQAGAKGLAPMDIKRMQQDDELSALRNEPEFEVLIARGLNRDESLDRSRPHGQREVED